MRGFVGGLVRRGLGLGEYDPVRTLRVLSGERFGRSYMQSLTEGARVQAMDRARHHFLIAVRCTACLLGINAAELAQADGGLILWKMAAIAGSEHMDIPLGEIAGHFSTIKNGKEVFVIPAMPPAPIP